MNEVEKSVICYGCCMNYRVIAVTSGGHLIRIEKRPRSPRGPCERCKAAPEWVYHKEKAALPLEKSWRQRRGKMAKNLVGSSIR